MSGVLDAIGVFFEHLAAVEFRPLGFAVAAHLVKMCCTSRAWRNAIKAAYPDDRVRWHRIFGAYASGVGVNAIIPARGGDVVRLYVAHRAVPGSSYPALGATLLVLSLFDMAMAGLLFAWALTQGLLPTFDALDRLPSFDFRWFFDHGRVSAAIGVALLVLGVVTLLWARRRVVEFRAHVAQGLAVLHDRSRYLRSVVFWQACDWSLRFVAIWFFLGAFGVHQSLRNVLLVQVTQSLATLVPISPAGIGTEQAFIVYAFRGAVSGTKLVAFSVGMKLTLVAVNVAVGFSAIGLTLRTFRFRRAIGDAGPDAIEPPEPGSSSSGS